MEIYDNDKVEQLIREYKAGEEHLLEDILQESRALVEVIVTRYNTSQETREDMIQECLIKIMKAIPYYNPDMAKAHSYFTSVITNKCNDFINKHNRQKRLVEELKLSTSDFHSQAVRMPFTEEYILRALKERNRRRFPSIDTDELDAATEYIFREIIDAGYSKSPGSIKDLTENFSVNRHEAMILYNSCLAWLRYTYRDEVCANAPEPKEISLLPELREMLGDEAYEHLALVLSGMYVRFP